MLRYIVNDRRVYAYSEAAALTQDMLDETFRGGENQLEVIGILTKVIGINTFTLRFSDRPKFVNENWYEGRASFPEVKRTIGELQSPSLSFSQFEVQLANVDGFYNEYLEGGANYLSWIGATLEIKLGLRDVGDTYFTIFDGIVPDEDGFEVSRERLTIRANDRFTSLNNIPRLPYINTTDFSGAPTESIGKMIPMVIGDWEAGFNVVDPAGAVNIDNGGTSVAIITAAPDNFYGGLIGYYVGGGYFVFSVGTYTPDTISSCYIKRGDTFVKVTFNATPANTAGYWSVQVTAMNREGGGTIPYVYNSNDLAVIKVKVPYDIGKYSNPIEIAQQLLIELGGISLGAFTANWAIIAAKSTPAQSDMTTIKARVWVGDDKDNIISLALGVLEQVRCEAFFNLAGDIDIRTLHFEDFPDPDDCPRIEQVEMDEKSIKLTSDERTFFNQAFLNYAFTPVSKKTERLTIQMKNQDSITKSGKTVAKVIDCPWLYVEADADYQLIEFLRLYSTGLSYIGVQVAWVHILRELGDFVSFNYEIGSLVYNNVPMQIRDIGVNPSTCSPNLRLLSFANFAYADYQPDNYLRFLSGASQVIIGA